jgi:hypothetical protein
MCIRHHQAANMAAVLPQHLWPNSGDSSTIHPLQAPPSTSCLLLRLRLHLLATCCYLHNTAHLGSTCCRSCCSFPTASYPPHAPTCIVDAMYSACASCTLACIITFVWLTSCSCPACWGVNPALLLQQPAPRGRGCRHGQHCSSKQAVAQQRSGSKDKSFRSQDMRQTPTQGSENARCSSRPTCPTRQAAELLIWRLLQPWKIPCNAAEHSDTSMLCHTSSSVLCSCCSVQLTSCGACC